VQAVDQWWPAARALRERFDVQPGWRFDDIMVSYAVDQGGVGPHFDYYDVFLLQASGRRRWHVGQPCDASTVCRADTELRILQQFEAREDFLVEPGDLLYIPPGLAHWGVADGPCMTWSVGYRAPSHAEVLQELAAERAAALGEDRRFADPGVVYPASGEIPQAALRQLRRVLRDFAADERLLADWFGRYMTTRKYPELELGAPRARPRKALQDFLRAGGALERHPASRFAWIQGEPPTLFVDGESWPCEATLASVLCGGVPLDHAALRGVLRRKRARELLDSLVARGTLYRV